MKTVALLVLCLFVATPAFAQTPGALFIDDGTGTPVAVPNEILYEEYTHPDPVFGTARRFCLSEDGSCTSYPYQPDFIEQLLIVNTTAGRNTSLGVRQDPNCGTDSNRDAALLYLKSSGDGILSLTAYGCNYPDSGFGMGPLRNKNKILSDRPLIFGTEGSGNVISVVVDGTHVAGFNAKGFGFGALAQSGANVMSLGWGGEPSSVEQGTVSCWVNAGTEHLYCKRPNGAVKCLTC